MPLRKHRQNVAALAPGGGGPPPGYTTGAVAFGGATSLLNAALTASDSSVLTAGIWVLNQASANTDPVLWIVDPLGLYGTDMDLTYNDGRISIDAIAADATFARATSGTSFTSPPGSTVPVPIPNDTWVWLGARFSVNHADGSKIFQLFLGDQDVTEFVQDGVGAINAAFSGLPFYIGTDTFDGDWFVGYMADLWIAPGQDIDLSIEANRRKFISDSGKPVDLGSDGSAPTGTTPAIFLRRAPAAAASTFATNLGTGGNFAITGTLTNASSSPSD